MKFPRHLRKPGKWNAASFRPPKPTQSPAKRVWVGKEEGRSGYGISPAPSETGEMECSEFLLTFYPHSAVSMGMTCFLRLITLGRKNWLSLGCTLKAC